MRRGAAGGLRTALVGRAGAVAIVVAVLGAGCGGDDATPQVESVAADDETNCLWVVAGHDVARSHSTTCEEGITRGTLDRLQPVWFHETAAEVTGAPVVDEEALYFADWDGVVHSLARGDGGVRWEVQLPTSEFVYAGQSPASPVLASVAGEPAVIATSGRTVAALHRSDGRELWSTTLGDPDDADDPTEVEGAPVVTGDKVLVPSDVHGADGYRSGLVALSVQTGSPLWRFDPEEGVDPRGCGAVWGSPAVDLANDLAIVGTGNCNDDASWTDASEAVVGIDLATGEMQWSFQPHERGNLNDWDFAGAPNLYAIDGRPVAGLGNKDGHYYVVDRTTGELVWEAEAQRQSGSGDGFAFGGFIGALALVDDVLVGGTAVGDCPCQHAFDAATGELLWQNDEPTGTYAAAAGVGHPGDNGGSEGGFVFQTGIDQTLRAFDVATGNVLWEATLPSISSSGPAIAGRELFIGVGFREPGSPPTGGGGVQAYRVLAEGEEPPPPPSTTVPTGGPVTALEPSDQPCVGSPCDIPFTLKAPPPGLSPGATLEITTDPLEVVVEVDDLGAPADWLDPDSPAAADGASAFMVFLTPRDDRPELASILCTFEEGDDGCTAGRIEVPADQWTRLSIVAVTDPDTPPTLQEGFDRLVTTHSFDPALRPA